MVVNIFGKAANTVAAHFHLAAVSIVDLHLEIGDFRRMNRKQLIGANTEAAIAELFGNRFQVADVLSSNREKQNRCRNHAF